MDGRRREHTPNVWAVVVAAGTGERLRQDTPKAFIPLAGRPMFEWSLAATEASGMVSGIVLVVPPSVIERLEGPAGGSRRARVIVGGGRTRQESVVAGLAQVPGDVDVIIVHDAARPLAEPALFRAVTEALDSTGAVGAVPVVAIPDTVKRVASGRVVETVARDQMALAQTPQAFIASALLDAHAQARAQALEGTDDAMLLEVYGYRVAVVEGDPENFKVTTPEDLERAEAILARRAEKRPEASGE